MAGVLSFGFVFIHPFLDGNGRIHRFLIHNLLAVHGITPEASIFPVSATMLRKRSSYDETLESFSAPLMRLIDFDLDADGKLSVSGETAAHYRFVDYTHIVERVFDFVNETIEKEMPEEFQFLAAYDATVREIEEVVNLPDRDLDLFVRIALQNKGKLSGSRRVSHFARLTDGEIALMEEAVSRNFRLKG
jgi:hypothetical protein